MDQFSKVLLLLIAIGPKPGPQSTALCGAVCIVNSYGTWLNLPIESLLFLFICFSMFFVLIHDYTLCFIGSPYWIFSYCKFSYYNYISIWPYYIVIHYTVPQMALDCRPGLLGGLNQVYGPNHPTSGSYNPTMPIMYMMKYYIEFQVNYGTIPSPTKRICFVHSV